MGPELHFDVTDPIIDVFTDGGGDESGRFLCVHRGLLANSCEYIVNALAAAAQVAAAADIPVFPRQNSFIVVDVPFNVMALFSRWLYAPRKDDYKHEFTSMTDILHVWQWTERHLHNRQFRDGLINEMVKLITTSTDSNGPDEAAAELIRGLKAISSDVTGGMARFLADWFSSYTFTDDTVRNDFTAILTINGTHPSLCQAIIQAKLHERFVPRIAQQELQPQGPSDACKYHEHAPEQRCSFRLPSIPQKPQQPEPEPEPEVELEAEPEPPVPEQVVTKQKPACTRPRSHNLVNIDDNKGQAASKRPIPSNAGQPLGLKMETDEEVLKYVNGPNEDFTKMKGNQRTRMRGRVRRRMLKAKGVLDSKGRRVKQVGDSPDNVDSQSAGADEDSDTESIAVAATASSGVTTRSTRASLRNR